MTDYEKLLNKYETKQPGEIWGAEREAEAKRAQRSYYCSDMLDGIVNEIRSEYGASFVWSGEMGEYARYYLANMDMKIPVPIEKIIVIVIIVVKLEFQKTRIVKDYEHILEKYDVGPDLFTRVLMNVMTA